MDGAQEEPPLTANALASFHKYLHPPTQIRYDDPDFANPPDLNYGLRSRKLSIAIFWTLIVLDCVAMPIALYFGLWYGTSLSPNAGEFSCETLSTSTPEITLTTFAVFSISTGALGSVSIIEYFLRFHRLWKKGSR